MAKIHALATDLSVDTVDWVHQKSGPGSAQIGWLIAKEAGLLLTYSDLVNTVIECRFHLLYNPQAAGFVRMEKWVLNR